MFQSTSMNNILNEQHSKDNTLGKGLKPAGGASARQMTLELSEPHMPQTRQP